MSDWQSKSKTSFQEQNATSVITTKKNTYGGDTVSTYKYGINTYGLGVYGIGIPQSTVQPLTLNWQMKIETDDMMEKTSTSWQEKNS